MTFQSSQNKKSLDNGDHVIDLSSNSGFASFLQKFQFRAFDRLVLIQPALVPEEYFDQKTALAGGYYNFPPVGLLYLASAVRSAHPNLNISILDLNHEILKGANLGSFNYNNCWKEKFEIIRDSGEHVIFAVSYMFGTTKPCFESVVRYIRANFPSAFIMSGGVQATFDAQELISSGYVDMVALNEGEEQMLAIVSSLLNNSEIVIPKGSWINSNGNILQLGNPVEGPDVNFDLREVYNLIPIEEYHKYGGLGAFSRFVGADIPFSTVLSRRGCRARCTFCTVRNFNGLGVRKRNVQDVIDEIKYLVNQRGVGYIDWLDDDLLFDREQVLSLFRGIAEQIPNLKWTASNGLIGVSIDEEMVDAMASSGLQAYKIGIESGNDNILHQIKKPTTKKKLRLRKDIFTKHKHILFSTNLIIGFPEETFAQMMDTYLFAQELKQDWASFYIMQPLRGTEIYSTFQSLGDERCDVESYDKTINPGRSSERGEFGYNFQNSEKLYLGWDVFNIPSESKPNLTQQKEIWFTFNLTENFLNNPNYSSLQGTKKLLRWLVAIYAGYPYDASMVAAMAHCYYLLSMNEDFQNSRQLFLDLTNSSDYWKERCRQFPELFRLAGLEMPPEWYNGTIPAKLFRHEIVDEIISLRRDQ